MVFNFPKLNLRCAMRRFRVPSSYRKYGNILKDIENYATRTPEVLDSIGRFIRIYDPELRCENGSFLKCVQGNIEAVGKVIRQVGDQRFDIDILGARLDKGALEITLLDDRFSIKVEKTSIEKLRWTEGESASIQAFSMDASITLGIASVDAIAPIKRGATHLVFYDQAYPISIKRLVDEFTRSFESPVLYTSQSAREVFATLLSFEDSDDGTSLDVFSEFTTNADLAWLDCSYSPEFATQLGVFEKARNPTTTVVAFIKTSMDVFPIIESLNFGDIEALWVIDEEGRLDPTRTRTRVLDGDLRRASIMNAIYEYKEAKFEADLLGEPFSEEIPFPEIWEPIF